jgi:hypothetical protein
MNANTAIAAPFTGDVVRGMRGFYYGSIETHWGVEVVVTRVRQGRLQLRTSFCTCPEHGCEEMCVARGGHMSNVRQGSVHFLIRNEGPNVMR